MPDKKVKIYFSIISEFISDKEINEAISQLPSSVITNLPTYLNPKNKYLSLIAWLMLKKLISDFNMDESTILEIKKNEFGKPSHPDLYFNYSHSGNIVICAASKNLQLGIDVEKIRDIQPEDYINCFTEVERDKLLESIDNRLFFDLWCKKESVAKADGKGMTIPFNEIIINKNQALIFESDKMWFLQSLNIHAHYCAYVCTSEISEISLIPFIEWE